MGAMPATQRMTSEEFLALPYSKERRYRQLIEGELVVDAPRPLHQWVAGELIYVLMHWCRSGAGRGTVWHALGVQLDERNVFQPDVLWYSENAGPDVHSSPPAPVPQLAIEVRSPSTWRWSSNATTPSLRRSSTASSSSWSSSSPNEPRADRGERRGARRRGARAGRRRGGVRAPRRAQPRAVAGARRVTDPAGRRSPRAGRGVRVRRLRAGHGEGRGGPDHHRPRCGQHPRGGGRGLGLAAAGP